jgi:hypothetical protein
MIQRLWLSAVVVLAGCSPGPAAPSSPVVPTGTPAAVGTPGPTPLAFESTIYPYGLTLPAGVAYYAWTPATRQWQRDASIFRGSPDNDEASTVEGQLFIVGMPWTDGLRDFEELVLGKLAESHQCQAPVVRKDLTIGPDAAIGITQLCATSLVFTRVFVKHGSYALAISLGSVTAAKQATILDELAGWLNALTWRAES